MTPEFAQSLAELRLRQTAGLLAWMAENGPDQEAVRRAREAVDSAYSAIQRLRVQNGAGQPPPG